MNSSDVTNEMAKWLYEQYYAVHPRYRHRSQWVMTQEMHDQVAELAGVELPDDPDPDDSKPRLDRSYLLGLPIEIRDGVEGVRLERIPPRGGWACGQSKDGERWWHQPGCPHIDWTNPPEGSERIANWAADLLG